MESGGWRSLRRVRDQRVLGFGTQSLDELLRTTPKEEVGGIVFNFSQSLEGVCPFHYSFVQDNHGSHLSWLCPVHADGGDRPGVPCKGFLIITKQHWALESDLILLNRRGCYIFLTTCVDGT